ncbi:MAG: radical SAM family heme chaperone HemW [Clostridiales Family XIII bacterium]|jgi:oxygen-independent coproporphyrinogen-3 oxidase|nr:radical SAM family heme chaperone HemW [Clostridiales Family XIII bacterium]
MKTSDESSPIGVYIHIPFCAHKCRYCDFTSFPIGDAGTHLAYIMQVIHEMRAKRPLLSGGSARAPEADTVYIGGGTPSLIEAGFVTELLDAVYAGFRVSDDAEITIEVNPGTTDAEKFRRYFAAGVNRVSVGAQSFHAGTLGFLGRIHRPEETLRCVWDARDAGFDDINIDLIFGVPGQSLSDWAGDLAAAAALDPAHVSFYSLQIEEGTPLFEDFVCGAIDAADDILDRRMYHFAKERLAARGLCQYEISNSAKPGKASRHNLKYWSMEPYAGFGVGAHSYFGGRRFSNTSELACYLSAESGVAMMDWTHKNTLSDDMSEFIFLGLRRTAGIELSRFRAHFGRDFWEIYGEETEKLIGRGLLEKIGDVLRLTALGLDLANNVFSEYV